MKLCNSFNRGFRSYFKTPIHQLIDTLTLSNVMEPEKYILPCIEIVDQIQMNDIGLTQSFVNSLSHSTCMNVCLTKKYHLVVFIIPPGRKLPLHDHPGMTVISKLVVGQIFCSTYTKHPSFNDCFLKTDMTKSNTDKPWYLTSSEGNFHEFVALKPSVIFDIILPPYDDNEGRICTYYSATEHQPGLWKLHSKDAPNDILPYLVPYKGIKPSVCAN